MGKSGAIAHCSVEGMVMKCFLLAVFTFFSSIAFAKLPEANEWQFVDQDSGQVFPWYARPFLDELVTWDIKDWNVFEWGSGYSTLWFASHCHSVVSVDTSREWVRILQQELDSDLKSKVILKYRPGGPQIQIGGGDSLFVNSDDAVYDCIIIDGACHRNTCAEHVLKHLKPDGILI